MTLFNLYLVCKKINKLTKILIPSETSSGERRVSATPEAVKKLKSLGCDVYIESSAGKLSGFSDLSYCLLYTSDAADDS